MKFALFLGCNIPARVQQYELSARAVSDKLGIEIADNSEFKCCGNPIRNTDNSTFLLMAARNLALAENQGLDMMVLCKCCFGSLKKAAHLMKQNPSIQEEVNAQLSKVGLRYTGTSGVKHFLSILYHDIGINALKEKVTRPFKKIKIATHYGCHALRPSDITGFDNPVAPVLFDELVSATGAQSIDWPLKLECCGAPLLGVNDSLSMDLTEKKLADGKRAGADYLCVACPYCQMQFDRVQQMMMSSRNTDYSLFSVLFPQLLGLAMGIGGEALGIHGHVLDISGIESFLE
ncbi:MAG: CoB--CoM heterodisulfide reductase iron-sulfur subunit B family protein [Desulfosalsimonadaceae bacterium]|nr:CoB--CoM heterodisulfide reductase iron-sulfur subunit B family protein [Desulfosalsimonadaceae bacterium]